MAEDKSNTYPKAGKSAPAGIQQEVDSFRKLSPEERAKTPLLYHLLGAGTPDYKMSPEDSDYVDVSEVKEQSCANCEFLYFKPARDRYICSQIAGPVKPKGWCRLWKEAGK